MTTNQRGSPASIRPSLDLGELYGSRLVVIRTPENRSRWLFSDSYLRDAVTGAVNVAAGTLKILCWRSGMQPVSRSLFEHAGLPIGSGLIPFDDEEDHRRLIHELAPRFEAVVLQHAYPAAEVESLRLWVPLETLSRVNNKGELSHFVSESHLCPRTLVKPEDLARVVQHHPVLIKAVTDDSTGGGFDVMICRTHDDAIAARDRFQGLERVVVEEWQDFVQTICMHYAIFRDGRVEYFGAAEQIIRDDGRHRGNWMGSGVDPSKAMIEEGLQICRRAWDAGYWGVAGMDMGILADGGFRVFDLNFRLNSSTAAALLLPSIIERRGPVAARSGLWLFPTDLPSLVPFLEEEIERGHFIPTNVAASRSPQSPDEPPFVFGMLVGESREEVLAIDRIWAEKASALARQ